MLNQDCSVLVLSCDKNISLLNIFFDHFSKMWMDCPFQVYIGLEEKDVEYKEVKTLRSDKKGWGGRLIGYLEEIKTDYVMLVLDDFIPERDIDTGSIIHYINMLKKDTSIATISFADIYDSRNAYNEVIGLCRRQPNADYLLNLQVGVWDKKVLKLLLKNNESPWQTELFGSIRARQLKDKTFLCLRSDEMSPFRYNRGWLMVRGIWNGNEIKRLGLEKYANDLFDGKDIQYSDLMHIDLMTRVKRRVQIEYRKLISHFGIYL